MAHGGKRPGAGRPKGSRKEGRKIKINLYLAQDVVDFLRAKRSRVISTGEIVEYAVRRTFHNDHFKDS